MKNKFSFYIGGLFLLLIVASLLISTTFLIANQNTTTTCLKIECKNTSVAKASIFDKMTPQMVDFFETKIAQDKILSSMKQQKIDKMMQSFNISKNKLFSMIALQFVAQKNGKNLNLNELAHTDDFKFLKIAQQEFSAYLSSLPNEQRTEIMNEVKNLIKNSTKLS